MKGKALPFRCVSRRDSEVFINLKAQRPSRLLGVAIFDKVKMDSQALPVTCSVSKGEAKIRNLPRNDVTTLRQWHHVKVLDLLTKTEWILDMQTYRYAPERYDSHDRVRWNLVAYPSALMDERLKVLDIQGLQGEIQISLL